MKCKHSWKILSEATIKSDLDVMKENGFRPDHIYDYNTKRTLVQIIACEKCGKINKYVTSN